MFENFKQKKTDLDKNVIFFTQIIEVALDMSTSQGITVDAGSAQNSFVVSHTTGFFRQSNGFTKIGKSGLF